MVDNSKPGCRIHLNIPLLFLIACLCGCHNKKQDLQWGNAAIDSTIATDSIYRQLDKEGEVFSMHEKRDSSVKRTSGVSYFTKGHVNIYDSSVARFNNCRAYYFLNSDVLFINVGIGNGFGGYGFIINYKAWKFFTQPYYVTDVIDPDQSEPQFEIVYQNLTLNKSDYKVGDSVYGKVAFKTFEIDNNKNRITHSGEGYFRSVVRLENHTIRR